MPDEELRVTIRLRDFMTRQLKKVQGTVGRFAAYTIAKFRAIGASIFSLRTGLIALAGTAVLVKVSKAFIRTAADVENMRLTLQSLLGDVSEANKLFDDLATFAGKVPFALEEIMKVGTMFAGVFKGGRKEVAAMMPLVADIAALAKPFRISFEDAGRQLSRMFTAGAAAADQFRDAGILAILGFQQGVSYSAEETKRKVIEEWEKTGSLFKGSAQRMANTWDGAVSMMGDAWFQFKKRVMEAGVFVFVKEGLRVLSDEFRQLTKSPKETAAAIIDSMETVARVLGMVGSGLKLLGMVFIGLGLVSKAVLLGIKTVVWLITKALIEVLSTMRMALIKLSDAGGIVTKGLAKVGISVDGLKNSIWSAEESMRGFAKATEDGMEATGEDMSKMAKKFNELRTGIPHAEMKAFFKRIREGLEVRKRLDSLTAIYVKLFRELKEGQKAQTMSTEDQILAIKALAIVEKAFREEGERGVKALAAARMEGESLLSSMTGVAGQTSNIADNAERALNANTRMSALWEMAKNNAASITRAMKKAANIQHGMLLNFKMLREIDEERLETQEKMAAAMWKAMDAKRLGEFNEKMKAWKSTFEEVRSAAMAVGGILVDNIMRSIDAVTEGTFRWRKALQDTAKDLSKMLLRQALMAAVQFGASALAGAAAGPKPTAPGGGGGLPAREPFSFAMRQGGVLGGFPSAQRGMLFNGDQLVRVGDNASKKEGGIFPLARGRHGRLGVEAVGAQPAPIQVNFNISTIDEKGVNGWLYKNRHRMADMTGLSRQEGRTGKSSF